MDITHAAIDNDEDIVEHPEGYAIGSRYDVKHFMDMFYPNRHDYKIVEIKIKEMD